MSNLSDGFPVFHAPNGLDIFHHAASETKYVYREIFEDKVYFRHGIDLKPGESVFDIGANIGIFTLFVKENYPGVMVHAFEPSPVIFPVLAANLARYKQTVSANNCGIGRERGQATFAFYPACSMMSGFHHDLEQDKQTLRRGIQNDLAAKGVSDADRFVEPLVEKTLIGRTEYLCELHTVSEFIDRTDSHAIGLLKIDTEGGEMDALAGIEPRHWPLIRQIVMEFHDADGSGRREVERLLGPHFDCIFEQEKRLTGSGIFTCYARRKAG